MFADRAVIMIRSGNGGNGHVSFRREKYVPDGGPDGGDGGKGGDVIFEVDEGMNTLLNFRHRRKFSAQNGEEGGKKRCHGKNGSDIVLKVPKGTVIKEERFVKNVGGVIENHRTDYKHEIIEIDTSNFQKEFYERFDLKQEIYKNAIRINGALFNNVPVMYYYMAKNIWSKITNRLKNLR